MTGRATARDRVCDLGYLRRAYRKPESTLGYRCPGEPGDHCVAKGGELAETPGRKCVCNGLLSTIGLGQIQPGGYREPALLTAGDDVAGLARFLPANRDTYSAADVVLPLARGVVNIAPLDKLPITDTQRRALQMVDRTLRLPRGFRIGSAP